MSLSEGSSSGGGTSGMAIWWSSPASATWKETSMEKIGRPCWMAATRLVVKLLPSRMRSTS